MELKSHKILFEGFTITPEEKDQDPNDLYDKYVKGKIKVPYSIKAKTKTELEVIIDITEHDLY